MHESSIYNIAQTTIASVAVFTGGMNSGFNKAANSVGVKPSYFVAGTLVMAVAGMVAIEKIKSGDKVISTDPETMETSPKTVPETYIKEVTTLVHLNVNGEEIITTVDHPFYVKNQGFIKAGELIVGDELLDVNGNVLLVENFDVELTEEPVKVYNFQVEDFHTYYVGENNILVHNAGKEYKIPKSRTGKEKATDIPSRFKGERPYINESGKDFAKRLCDEAFGKGNYDTGPKSDYNRLKKYGDRAFTNPKNRSKVMAKYYLTKIIYNGLTYFLIWYSNDEDGFLLFDQQLLVFFSVEEANTFADKEHIIFEKGITVFDLSEIIELINNVEISQNCRILIDIWHFFSDLSKSLNEEFIGDYNDEEIIDIYNKLFYGSNLELLKNEEYHPSFNVDEKHKCWEIFESGLSILNKYLNDDFSMK